ncbi:MAG: hypothetical protein JW709_00785 [Sedimentisphaerales bacterium]|nr:hypothetical protein [Sedimentisphaerales bacterium]
MVKRYQAQALVLAEFLTRDRSLAEDVVQEAFLTVYRRLDRLQHPSAFVAWLRQIIRRRAIYLSARQLLHHGSGHRNIISGRRHFPGNPGQCVEVKSRVVRARY